MNRTFARSMVILLLAGMAAAQQKSAVSSPPAKKSTVSPAKSTADHKPNVNLPSQETVNAFLQQMFGYDASLTWKVLDIKPSEAEGLAQVSVVLSSAQGSQTSTLYVTPDGKHALAGEMLPFGAKPFEPARQKLEKGINGPARGPADAPVTIVEFSDLQCPHCKEAQPLIETWLKDEPNVRFVFQNYPLPSHNWAAKAAAYADCVGRASSDAFWKFVQKSYEAQSQITEANADEKLTAIANDSGVKGADIAACAAKPETFVRVEHSVALGQAVEVNGTPTVFVNGRKIANLGLPSDTLKKIVEFAAKEGK